MSMLSPAERRTPDEAACRVSPRSAAERRTIWGVSTP